MIEIERKFLVQPGQWPRGRRQIQITQGYLVRTDGMVVRVRRKDSNYFLSLKARIDVTQSYDYEYSIPAADARTMFDQMCGDNVVQKTRHEVAQGALVWEIDEFHGANQGLVVAEIELPGIGYEVELPSWVSMEVTSDSRYRNASLAKHPYTTWESGTSPL